MPNIPMVSIIIRAKNEGESLITLLPLLYAQKTVFPFEVLLFDNDSNDQTKTISQNYPQLKCHRIPNNQFHFSKSLNDAAKLTQGEILVHLSAHCISSSFYWLQNLVQPLLDDSTTIAAYGSQFTDPNVNIYEEIDYSQLLFPKTGEPIIKTFSNANGAIRKNYLLEHSFNEEIPILEDHLWYLEINDKNKVFYVQKAKVLHLHPLFNLKYYIPRWQKEGQAVFYVNRIKNLTSPLTDLKQFNNLLSPTRVFSFCRTAISLIRKNLLLYGLFAPIFFVIRDYSWRKGLKQGAENFSSFSRSVLPKDGPFKTFKK